MRRDPDALDPSPRVFIVVFWVAVALFVVLDVLAPVAVYHAGFDEDGLFPFRVLWWWLFTLVPLLAVGWVSLPLHLVWSARCSRRRAFSPPPRSAS